MSEPLEKLIQEEKIKNDAMWEKLYAELSEEEIREIEKHFNLAQEENPDYFPHELS